MFRRHASRLPRSLQAFLGLFGLVLILSACGGGPTVATSTGRVLYVATTSGIYGFSIMSTGTLNPLSAQPLFSTPGILQIAATPGIPPGQSGPLLLAATGTSSSVSAWTIGGGGSLTPTTSLSCSSGLSDVTGLTVTSDSQYLILVDGNSQGGSLSNVNLGLIPFSKTSQCTTGYTSNTSATAYPLQPAIDCAVSGTSPCILFLTVSGNSVSSTLSLTTPQEIPVTPSSATFSNPSTPFSCTSTSCPFGVTFDPTTVFFYASFTGTNPPTLQSIAEGSKTATSQVSFPSSAPVNYPCVDTLGGVVYTPSANGFLYASQTNASGGLTAPSTVLTPSSLPTSLDMVSCAVVSNP